MWQASGISKKIWLSIMILILSYSASITVIFFLNKKSESQIYRITASLFPAAIQSQSAIFHFKEQIVFYNNAVLSSDESEIEKAGKKSGEILNTLQTISELPQIDDNRMSEIKNCVSELKEFTAAAQELYLKMSGSEVVDQETDMNEQASDMASQTLALQEKLALLAKSLSDNLKTELSDISETSNLYTRLNMGICIGAIIVSIIILSILISKSIVGPVSRTTAGLMTVAKGVTEISGKISSSSEVLSGGVSDQVSSVRVASSSLDEMVSISQQNAQNLN